MAEKTNKEKIRKNKIVKMSKRLSKAKEATKIKLNISKYRNINDRIL